VFSFSLKSLFSTYAEYTVSGEYLQYFMPRVLFSGIHNEVLFDEKLRALQMALDVNNVGVVRLIL
jgi:hypothetical protein